MTLSAPIPQPKPKYKRRAPTRKERGRITQAVANETDIRSGGKCEWCGLPPAPGTYRDRLEKAHLIGRAQGGRGDVPWNVVNLCGPSVNSGTCHHMLDYNRKTYRDWTLAKITELEQMYDKANWPE